MLCPLFFLIKINKGEIRTANPPLSANAKRFYLAAIESFDVFRICIPNIKFSEKLLAGEFQTMGLQICH